MSKVSILTPSYNKTHYVLDAIKSVQTQTMTDWEYWVIENSTDMETRELIRNHIQQANDPRIKYIERNFTPEQRKEYYVTTRILNEYLDQMNGEYLFYLSDDDTLAPACFDHMLVVNEDVIFCDQQSLLGSYDTGFVENGVRHYPYIFENNMDKNCILDGGQVMFRKTCLQKLEKPYYDEHWELAACCDGRFLDKLGKQFRFHPVSEILCYHRKTPLSTFDPKL